MGWYDWINDKMSGAPDLMKLREDLLKDARGKTLEIGFGTGHNAGLYDPTQVESVVGSEPSRGAEKRGGASAWPTRACRSIGWRARVTRLPFADGTFDTVVTTLVLCTKTHDPQAIVAEIKRVLKPGGKYLFLEHGYAPTEKGQKQQQRFNGLHKLVLGCKLDSPIRPVVEGAGFSRVEKLEDYVIPGNPPFIHMFHGIAIR